MKICRIFWLSVFILSITFNLLFLIDYINLPTYKQGVLLQDIEIASFSNDRRILFKLPKGMTIMDASPRGIASAGLFFPTRISFMITVNRSWIDYSSPDVSSDGALYNGQSFKE